MSRSRLKTVSLLVMQALMLGVAPPCIAQASKQVVFSGAGTFAYDLVNPTDKHFGFWIWCEGESTNPYFGVCSGAMYFYGIGITKHVAGGVSEISEGIYKMTVASTADDSIQNCTLQNAATPKQGPNNTVNVKCDVPEGSGSSTNAVVNVTGP